MSAREQIMRRLAMTGGGYSNPADDAKLLDQYAHELAEQQRAACLGGGCGNWGRCTCEATADLIDPKERTP